MSADLMRVSKGLKLIFRGLMLFLLAVVLGSVAMIGVGLLMETQGPMGGLPLLIVMAVFGTAAVAGNVVGLIGRVYCLATPDEARRAKSRITLSTLFEACWLFSGVVTIVDYSGTNLFPPEVRLVAAGFSNLMQLAAAVLFLLFAKSFALFVRSRSLADDAVSALYPIITAFTLYLFGMGVIVVVPILGGNWGPCVGVLLIFVALIFGAVALVKYARVVTNLSMAVHWFAREEARYEESGEGDKLEGDRSHD